MRHLLSETALSNLFTMAVSGQKIPLVAYAMPDEETRRLRAELILEEAIETIEALGFIIGIDKNGFQQVYEGGSQPDMEGIIDGVCDLSYVGIGTLIACGVPDLPHQRIVNGSNNAKFPNGQGIPHPTIKGKFGKPLGWTEPQHEFTEEDVKQHNKLNFQELAEQLVKEKQGEQLQREEMV